MLGLAAIVAATEWLSEPDPSGPDLAWARAQVGRTGQARGWSPAIIAETDRALEARFAGADSRPELAQAFMRSAELVEALRLPGSPQLAHAFLAASTQHNNGIELDRQRSTAGIVGGAVAGVASDAGAVVEGGKRAAKRWAGTAPVVGAIFGLSLLGLVFFRR